MQIISELVGSVLPIVATAFCSYYFAKLQSREKLLSAREKADLVLLRDKLIYYYDKYGNKGEIPRPIYENMLEMKECYLSLGGNGTVKHMCEEMEGMKIV